MRLIDADALIKFIDCGHLRNPLEMCFSERDVVDMIESRPTVNQWIPCSERLPELRKKQYVPHPWLEQIDINDFYMLSEPVLVFRTGDNVEEDERIVVALYEDDLDGRTYWETLDAEILGEVIAWMPLPEPYMMEVDDAE